jgi:hypothetical protein
MAILDSNLSKGGILLPKMAKKCCLPTEIRHLMPDFTETKIPESLGEKMVKKGSKMVKKVTFGTFWSFWDPRCNLGYR